MGLFEFIGGYVTMRAIHGALETHDFFCRTTHWNTHVDDRRRLHSPEKNSARYGRNRRRLDKQLATGETTHWITSNGIRINNVLENDLVHERAPICSE